VHWLNTFSLMLKDATDLA
jgi:hypothetical protein